MLGLIDGFRSSRLMTQIDRTRSTLITAVGGGATGGRPAVRHLPLGATSARGAR
ncbi:hypothetical protein [Nonomuraea sp. NPDC003804]|uniref:hypothetical protein n=1 Tax=Nonomuraea sp. NPDC003804 TaxID=3154547 RepID=UPI0033BDBC39